MNIKLYLFSPEVVIPLGKSERLNDDLTMEQSKHLLDEHGSRFPGSPKAHSRVKTSQRWIKTFREPIFVLHVTMLLPVGLELELELKNEDVTRLYFMKLFSTLFFTTTIYILLMVGQGVSDVCHCEVKTSATVRCTSCFAGAENKEERYLSRKQHDQEELQWETEPWFQQSFRIPLCRSPNFPPS